MKKKITENEKYFVLHEDNDHPRAPQIYFLFKRIYSKLNGKPIFSHNQEVYSSYYKNCIMKRFSAS